MGLWSILLSALWAYSGWADVRLGIGIGVVSLSMTLWVFVFIRIKEVAYLIYWLSVEAQKERVPPVKVTDDTSCVDNMTHLTSIT